ncbi:SEC-C metal-binding domain-containing protein [Paenibacillus puerhi]|uniref:SEC-C metal-binding domain-containing protein n=1 Tax=Paenibacillus puerhi TaxID=2692622 RepID=UPI001916935F|nr:SEC-C metal-binding domain-containing protein [Paenibacillus puerhi]
MKIGRNEPCYCGSGKKYKRCCLGKGQEPAIASTGYTQAPSEAVDLRTEAVQAPVPAPTLEEIKRIAETGIRWESEAYAHLAHQLISHMADVYEPRHIGEALSVWDNFSREKRPSFKKEGAFCAALEYMVVQAYGLPVTQNDLALKYEVSSSTLSKRYQELLQFADGYFDPQSGGATSSPSRTLPPGIEAERALRRQQNQEKQSSSVPGAEAEAGLDTSAGKKASGSVIVAAASSSPAVREEAQELLYAAMEAGSAEEAAKLAHAALELYTHSADAYGVLAGLTEDPADKKRLLAEGIAAGERDLAESCPQGGSPDVWLRAEARPYMRTKLAYAEACWELKEPEETAIPLEELLKLDPADPLGARYLLLAAYLEQNRLEEAGRLLQTYTDDQSVTFVYDRLIFAYKKLGKVTPELNAPYRQAMQHNPHVLDFLFGGKPLPKPGSGTTTSAEEEAAVVYVTTHIRLWIKLPELLVWIYKQGR